MTVFLANDGERNHDELRDHIEVLESLQSESEKGKRFTYCDGLRHLVSYHDVDVDILTECLGKENTDLQNIMIVEGI